MSAARNELILDVATAPLEQAADFLEEPSAPSNYKDPDKIAAYLEQARAAALGRAALDLDLCRLTAVGLWPWGEHRGIHVAECRDEAAERRALEAVAGELAGGATFITYAGLRFDLPVLQRRALYLGMAFPRLDLDRYRSPHRDLCELLAGRERDRMRSLDFYCKRLGWADLLPKPLDGAEEARVHETGRWEELAASVRRDVEAVRRLAVWMGELPGEDEPGTVDLGF